MQVLHLLHMRSSTRFCRSLKREKDQLQQRLDAQQAASVVPQASYAESELQVKALQEQISQSEELLQVGTARGCRKQHSLLEFLQVAPTKAQGVLQCYNEGTAFGSRGARQACICYVVPV
jgi:phage-related minor tail protein